MYDMHQNGRGNRGGHPVAHLDPALCYITLLPQNRKDGFPIGPEEFARVRSEIQRRSASEGLTQGFPTIGFWRSFPPEPMVPVVVVTDTLPEVWVSDLIADLARELGQDEIFTVAVPVYRVTLTLVQTPLTAARRALRALATALAMLGAWLWSGSTD